jgi:Kef-type K+ transport system membrane component KefB
MIMHTDPMAPVIIGVTVILACALIGLQVKLEVFVDWKVSALTLGLLIAAVVGKMVSSLVAAKGTNKFVISVGMMCRGEVGLVFASIGKTLGVLDASMFTALVFIVMATTFATPGLLKLSLREPSRSE